MEVSGDKCESWADRAPNQRSVTTVRHGAKTCHGMWDTEQNLSPGRHRLHPSTSSLQMEDGPLLTPQTQPQKGVELGRDVMLVGMNQKLLAKCGLWSTLRGWAGGVPANSHHVCLSQSGTLVTALSQDHEQYPLRPEMVIVMVQHGLCYAVDSGPCALRSMPHPSPALFREWGPCKLHFPGSLASS